MENEFNINPGRQEPDESELEQFSHLEKKINVDRAAIVEAIQQVGRDPEKVEAYLINTRGL